MADVNLIAAGSMKATEARPPLVITPVDSTTPKSIICVVGEELREDVKLQEAMQAFDSNVRFSVSGDDVLSEYEDRLPVVSFVVSRFDTDVFTKLHKKTSKIFGPTAVFHYSKRKLQLPFISRPLFCTSMNRVVACFTRLREKQLFSELVDLVHHMGGSVRKDFSPSVTHLITNGTSGEKYNYAVCLGRPVMTPDWVYKAWEYNLDETFSIFDLPLSEYKVKPFVSCKVAFKGFSDEEKQHMEELTVANGGSVCLPDDPTVTHIVFGDDKSVDYSPNANSDNFVYFVKAEWFWASIQMDVRADEAIYHAKSYDASTPSHGGPPSLRLTPNSRARKRKRLKDTLGRLANLENSPVFNDNTLGSKQRRSAELTAASISPSLFDCTTSPTTPNPADGGETSTCSSALAINGPGVDKVHDFKNMSPRLQVCYELLQTENNYVGILQTIITLIKEPIEDPDQVGGPLLDPTDVKIIFGNLQPIYDVHSQIKNDLCNLTNDWNEENSVGKVVMKYSQDLLKAYPPFINFFEKTKETLLKCDASKPRFHAFLKICQSKPECGRQSLVELLIRPVQRLPSVMLLLNDIQKHTSKTNPDYMVLEEAITCLKEIMTHINEDKRKTEGQVAMFAIVNDIENCPPHLLSSHRNFVLKADMTELSDTLSGKGDQLTMFLFSDMLEICKRRKFAPASSLTSFASTGTSGNSPLCTRSPSVVSLHSIRAPQKNYKHIDLIPLSHIKRVVDVKETEDCHSVFALVCRSNHELKERLYAFALLSPETDSNSDEKLKVLNTLCRHVANAVYRTDAEDFLKTLEPHHLEIYSSDVVSNTLSKAVRFASKTSKKVGRAFSFNKTPRKLTRAVSTMMATKSKTASPSLMTASNRFPCTSTLSLQELESPSRTLLLTPNVGKKIKSFTLGPSSLLKRY